MPLRSARRRRRRLKLAPHGFDLIAELKLRSPVGRRPVGDARSIRCSGSRRTRRAAPPICSILTEPTRFDGDLEHLRLAARRRSQPYGVPAMRKDFLVDPYQVLEARAYGASGVLLIVRMVPRDRLVAMIDCAAEQGLFVLLEAFDADDLQGRGRARAASARAATSRC